MNITDGGPAFPVSGMTLLDWFATHIVNAVIIHHPPGTQDECEHLARRSYQMANAMLAERKGW